MAMLSLVLCTASVAFAADYQLKGAEKNGKTGIIGGDELTFPEDTVRVSLNARWGVKVIFQDSDEYGNTIFKEVTLPVTDSKNATTKSPKDPSHDKVTFTGWTRVDSNDGTAELGKDGEVIGINGPGPIIYQAHYDNAKLTSSRTVKTGDNMDVAAWTGIMLIALLAIMVPIAGCKRRGFLNKFTRSISIALVCTLIGCTGLTGVGSSVCAADGRYDVNYLQGTSDAVANMPENETGFTPGSDTPYKVSSTVPTRKGFEFIDWEVSWESMEKSKTPVDYSNAITASKKATAAAAGDANTERAYRITMEAKVNISANNPAGLFVEDLTVTDTIEDEFGLNGIKAEILDGEGNVISTETISATSSTVTHNFGNVKHGQTARLILEVTAQPDFIGSNGVYTNVGLSSWTYKHTEPDATAAEEYSVSCDDKPQVNVPVDFSVNPRGQDTSAKVSSTVTLDGTNIPKSAHSAAQKYDQTRGTFSYKWELSSVPSNGAVHDRIPVSDTVHISNGQPNVSADTLNAMGSLSYTIPLASDIGDHPARLYVTFTPDAAAGGTFADATTAEPVTAKTKDGYLICEYKPINTDIDIEPID